MASRENQGLQLSLIFFVAVTVALSVTCYFFWKKGDENRIAAANASSSLTQAQEAQRLTEAENRELKLLIGGYPAETSMTDIKTAHDQTMAYYGQLLQQPIDNYRMLVGLYAPELVRSSQDVLAAEESVISLTADVADARAQESAGVQKFQEANAELDDRFTQDLAQLQEPTEDMKTFASTTNALVGTMLTAFEGRDNAEIENLKGLIVQLREQAEGLTQDRERLARENAGMRSPTVDNPDGMVSWVNPASDSLYINVGSEDYLQRQMTFNIYDANASNLATAEPKGVIEVTALLEPHLAEARIVDYRLEDPILPGDYIFSPIWQPGQQLRFALLGKLDIDGDGDDDSAVVERLITLNGGVLEENELLGTGEDGNDDPIYGPQISVNTRYLVVGELLNDGSDERDLLRNNIVLATSEQYHVEQIPLDRLLNLMGYRGSERAIGLGRFADPEDFRPRPGDDNFRERRPSTPRSAYP